MNFCQKEVSDTVALTVSLRLRLRVFQLLISIIPEYTLHKPLSLMLYLNLMSHASTTMVLLLLVLMNTLLSSQRVNGFIYTVIDLRTISLYYIEPFPPPSTVSLINTDLQGLTFSWENIATNCCSILFKISASAGCGSCPLNTTSTSVVCSGAHIQQSENYQCTFSVLPTICGIDGNYSESLIVPLQGNQICII